MAGLLHVAVGIAAKPLSPQTPLPLLVAAGLAIDLAYAGLALAGLEGAAQGAPYSHGIVGALGIAAAMGLVSGLALKRAGAGLAVGLVAFGHWVGDLISHPMFGNPSGVTLFPLDAARIGLGAYWTMPLALVIDLGSFAAALAFYLVWRKRRKVAAAPGGE